MLCAIFHLIHPCIANNFFWSVADLSKFLYTKLGGKVKDKNKDPSRCVLQPLPTKNYVETRVSSRIQASINRNNLQPISMETAHLKPGQRKHVFTWLCVIFNMKSVRWGILSWNMAGSLEQKNCGLQLRASHGTWPKFGIVDGYLHPSVLGPRSVGN